MAHDAYTEFIKKEIKPNVESLRDDMARRKDPDFFWPNGTQVYCGRQGSGKTTAAVKHATIDIKQRYPKAILVSNLDLHYYHKVEVQNAQQLAAALQEFDSREEYLFFQDLAQLELVLTQVNNGFHGVIYLIDEIHTYFNALDSKAIPPWVFTEIAQQRKQRKVIIGTSQLFLRMAKPFREQCSSLIVCNTMLGFITRCVVFDGMSMTQDYDGKLSGDVKKTGWFFHTRRIRNAFDTFQKIQSGPIDFENIQQPLKIQKGRKKISIS